MRDLITLVISIIVSNIAALPYYFSWILVQNMGRFWQLQFWIFTFFTFPWVFLLFVAVYKKMRGIGLKPEVFDLNKNPEKISKIHKELFFHNFGNSLFYSFFHHFYDIQAPYLRLMGAKIGKNVSIGKDVLLQDLSVVEIGNDVILGQSCRISGHLLARNGKVIIGKVIVGDKTVIGGHALISPDVIIGKGCLIGVNALVFPGSRIPDGTIVPPFTVYKNKTEFKPSAPALDVP